MSKISPDHVVIHCGGKAGNSEHSLRCRHCGTIQRIALPMEVLSYLKLCRGFITQHTSCPITARGLASDYHAHCKAVGVSGDFGAVHQRQIRDQMMTYAIAAGISPEDVVRAIREQDHVSR